MGTPYHDLYCSAAAVHLANLQIFHLKVLNYQSRIRKLTARAKGPEKRFGIMSDAISSEIERVSQEFKANGFAISKDLTVIKSISTLKHNRISHFSCEALVQGLSEDLYHLKASARKSEVCRIMTGNEVSEQSLQFIDEMDHHAEGIIVEMMGSAGKEIGMQVKGATNMTKFKDVVDIYGYIN